MASMNTRYWKACFFGEMRVWVTSHSYKEFSTQSRKDREGSQSWGCGEFEVRFKVCLRMNGEGDCKSQLLLRDSQSWWADQMPSS
jgi:hypothetical protein